MGYLVHLKCHHNCSYKRSRGRFPTYTEEEGVCDQESRDWSEVATTKGMLAALEAGRGKEWDLPYSLQRKQQFGFSPVILILISGLLKCEKKKCMLF